MYRRSSALSTTPEERGFRFNKPSMSKPSLLKPGAQDRCTTSSIKMRSSQALGTMSNSLSKRVGSRYTPSLSSKFQQKTYTIKDTRELNERTLTKNLVEFLAKLNVAFSEESLRSPTTKQFQQIFEVIWAFFQPGFKFTTNEEVQKIFKFLGYPFPLHDSTMKTITAKRSWKLILGALDWLRQLAEYATSFHADKLMFTLTKYEGVYPFAAESLSYEIFCKHLDCYMLKLSGNENFESIDEAFRLYLKSANENNGNFEELLEENATLANELQEKEKELEELNKIPSQVDVLKLDIKKLNDFNKKSEMFIADQLLPSQQEADRQSELLDAEIAKEEAETARLEEIIRQQNMSQDEVKQILADRQRAQIELQTQENEISALQNRQDKLQMEIFTSSDEIMSKFKKFKEEARLMFSSTAVAWDPNWFNYLNADISPTDSAFHDYCASTLRPGIAIASDLLSKNIRDMESEISALKETLENKEEGIAEKHREITRLDKQIEEIDQKIGELEQGENPELVAKENELKRLKEHCEEYKRLMNMPIAEKQKRLEELEKEYEGKKKQFELENEKMYQCLKVESEMVAERYQAFEKDKEENKTLLAKLKEELMRKD